MSHCATQAGFFVLSPCNRPAARTCGSCGNYCCEQHSHNAEDGETYCQKCMSQRFPHEMQQNKSSSGKDHNGWEDEGALSWMYYYRDDFYASESFRPFDEQDYAGFDEVVGFSALDDELGEGGFFDS